MNLSLYSIGFIGIVLTLTIWFFKNTGRDKHKFQRGLLFIMMLVYALGLSFISASLETKLFAACRDFIILGLYGFIVQLLSRKKALLLPLIAASLAAYFLFYKGVQQRTFSERGMQLDQTGELLIQLNEGESVEEFKFSYRGIELFMEPAFHPKDASTTLLDNYLVADVSEDIANDLSELKDVLMKDPAVVFVEENQKVKVDPEETPAQVSSSVIKVNDPEVDRQWGLEAMKVQDLYATINKTGSQVKKKALVAILDTGVDANHEDIKDNYFSLSEKGNTDPNGHGTHCACVAGAVTNNQKGIASFNLTNDLYQITGIKILNGLGFASQKTIIQGIISAVDMGADVISLSLGGMTTESKEKSYTEAVEYARKKGIIIVAAAGNSGGNAKRISPANTKGVIAVAAIDNDLNKTDFSCSVEDVDMGLCAPGAQIYSCIPGNKYIAYNGTSMATPYVAGLIGLMKSFNPSISTVEAYQILNETGMSTNDPGQTGKLINPSAALQKMIKITSQ